MVNEAVYVNGFSNNSGVVDNHITERGSSWLYAACAILGKSQVRLFFLLPS